MSNDNVKKQIADRFRGFLPVVVDVETSGFDAETNALLEIAAIIIEMSPEGLLQPRPVESVNILPFENAVLDAKALEFNGIDPYHPFREAISEKLALTQIFKPIRQAVKEYECKRAILVGHNAFFDLSFINAAVKRSGIKRNPFHPFSTFDTVSLAGLAYGQTVLAKAAIAAGMDWDGNEAHSASYDTEKTAELFCKIVNQWESFASQKILN